jgi:Tfp pilus assembly protein PilO|tara:strand:- start:988 stop:1221 length:234 start_codon:yes stop_codon:yes gene_type:complete
MAMKISNGVSLGNIWSIVITLMALAVLWGSDQSKLEYVESEIEELSINKADKDVVEVRLEAISSDIAEIKEILKELK